MRLHLCQVTDDELIALLSRASQLLGSQAAVARAVGVSEATVCKVLRGKYGASLNSVKARTVKALTIQCPLNGALDLETCYNNYTTAASGVCPSDTQLRELYNQCKKCEFYNAVK